LAKNGVYANIYRSQVKIREIQSWFLFFSLS
jgi:hypothetical protein